MTAKEKAHDLVNKFYQPLGYLNISESAGNMWEHGKKCALIAVDEMLALGGMVGNDLSDSFYVYWQEVKEELELI